MASAARDIPHEMDGGDVDPELDNHQERVRPSIKWPPFKREPFKPNHTLSEHVNCSGLQNPSQSSPVSISAVWKAVMAEIWAPSWCLHSPDAWEDEEGRREGWKPRERENYLQLWRCSPKFPKSEHFWARTQHIMAKIGFSGTFYEGCLHVSYVDEWGADKGDSHSMFKARCLHFAFVSVHPIQTFASDECPFKQPEGPKMWRISACKRLSQIAIVLETDCVPRANLRKTLGTWQGSKDEVSWAASIHPGALWKKKEKASWVIMRSLISEGIWRVCLTSSLHPSICQVQITPATTANNVMRRQILVRASASPPEQRGPNFLMYSPYRRMDQVRCFP